MGAPATGDDQRRTYMEASIARHFFVVLNSSSADIEDPLCRLADDVIEAQRREVAE